MGYVIKMPMRDDSGEISESRGNICNTTGDRQTEKALQKAHNKPKLRGQECTAELRKSDAVQEFIETRLEFLREQREISTEFAFAIGNVDSPIRGAIASVGKFSGADRVSLFIFNDDGQTMNNVHEWCAEGVEPRSSNLKGCPIPTFTPWIDRLRNDEVINIPNVSSAPLEARAELEILQDQDIESVLIFPINTVEELNGFMVLGSGFDNTRSIIGKQDDGSIQLLQIASDAISAALWRMQTEEELRSICEAQAYAQGRLEVVDTILHNIGNAVNSVNIGVGTVRENIANNRLTRHLLCLADAVKKHQDDFSDYVENDPQGQKVAPFILALADDFTKHDEELVKIVNRVQERVEHITDIILMERMLGKRSVYHKNINLRKAIDNAITVLQGSIEEKNIEIDIDCDNAPKEIYTQENQFHRMLVNLIKNSIEAIDELIASEGLITTPAIRVKCYVGLDSLIIEVTDNGIGIEKDKLDIIFRSGYTTKDSGSGLGLHLIANFINGHGGQILALSDGIGKGATMRIVLPYPKCKSFQRLHL